MPGQMTALDMIWSSTLSPFVLFCSDGQARSRQPLKRGRPNGVTRVAISQRMGPLTMGTLSWMMPKVICSNVKLRLQKPTWRSLSQQNGLLTILPQC